MRADGAGRSMTRLRPGLAATIRGTVLTAIPLVASPPSISGSITRLISGVPTMWC